MNSYELYILKALSDKYIVKFSEPRAYVTNEYGKSVTYAQFALATKNKDLRHLVNIAIVDDLLSILDSCCFEYVLIRSVIVDEEEGVYKAIVRLSPNTDLEHFEELLSKSSNYYKKPGSIIQTIS